MGQTQINLRVDEDTKQEWDEAVETHPEATSLSHLIRLSVNREISGSHDSAEPTEVDLTPVIREMDDVKHALSDLTDRIDGLEVMADQSDELQEATLEVLRLLPGGTSEEIRNRELPHGTPEERALTTGTEPSILDVLLEKGYDELTIREAFTRALQITGVDKVETENGVTRYHFREGYK